MYSAQWQIQTAVEESLIVHIVNGACHNDCITVWRQNVYMRRSMIIGQCKVCAIVCMIVVSILIIYLLLDFQCILGIG